MRIEVHGTEAEAVEAARAGSGVLSRSCDGTVSEARRLHVAEVRGGYALFSLGDWSYPDYFELDAERGIVRVVASVAGEEIVGDEVERIAP